jgi:hypothetical protein
MHFIVPAFAGKNGEAKHNSNAIVTEITDRDPREQLSVSVER